MSSKRNSIQRVVQALERLNISTEIFNLPQSTRTAVEAARAVKCDVGQIVKSLVFQTQLTHQPILILTSGSNQVKEELVAGIIGEEISIASAEFVRNETGFSIGGVSPFGLIKRIPIFVDEDLLQYQTIWAAAGTPNAVFSISPDDLVSTTKGQIIKVQ
jgi:prolyl-tRNA editing enzyme YbaK/EbsC (Cys-tRNA(Pro) deacylase)